MQKGGKGESKRLSRVIVPKWHAKGLQGQINGYQQRRVKQREKRGENMSLKRKTPLKAKKKLQPKGRPGKKAKKPANDRGNLKKQAEIAKREHYLAVREIVFNKFGGKCQHPNCKANATDFHHIRYKSQGGQDDVENGVPLCKLHHTGFNMTDPCPHNYRVWREFWEAWQRAKYPNYAGCKRPPREEGDWEALQRDLQDTAEWSEELADFTI